MTSPNERPSERSARVGAIFGQFSDLDVSYGPGNAMIAAMDEFRHAGLAIRIKRAETGKKLPMPAMATLATIGTGKSKAAEKFAMMVNPKDPDDRRRPALLTTVKSSGNPAAIPNAILVELGKRITQIKDPEILWKRARDALDEYGVEIVIFDEMDRAARRPSMSAVIGADLMDFLVEGQCAVVFIGTEETTDLFKRAKPLRDRLKAPVVMQALDWESPDDQAEFIEFLDRMDEAMVTNGLVEAKAGLKEPVAMAKPLWEVSRGRLRPLCLLLEEAVTILHRSGGRRILAAEVLADAVESLLKRNEITAYNAFLGEQPE